MDTSQSILPTGGSLQIVANGNTYTPTAGIITIPEADVSADGYNITLEALNANGTVCSVDCQNAPPCPVAAGDIDFIKAGGAPCVAMFNVAGSYNDPIVPVYEADVSPLSPVQQDILTMSITNPNDVPIKVPMLISQSFHTRAEGLLRDNVNRYAALQTVKVAEIDDPWLYDGAPSVFDVSDSFGGLPWAHGFCNDRWLSQAIAPMDTPDITGTTNYLEPLDIDSDDFAGSDSSGGFGFEILANVLYSGVLTARDMHEHTVRLAPGETKTLGFTIYMRLSSTMLPHDSVADFNDYFGDTSPNWVGLNPFRDPTDDPAYDQANYYWMRWHSGRGFCFCLDQSDKGLLAPTLVTSTTPWATGQAGAGL